MNSLTLSRCALSVCAAVTLLVGCGGLQPAGITQGPIPQGQMPDKASRETVLYSFRGSHDGAGPAAALTYFKGTLYGTTLFGGEPSFYLGGTVYSITPSGTETVLHRFKGAEDGESPGARLIVRNGTLYSTDAYGGEKCSCGTVFSITPSGHETVLHEFIGPPDGWRPFAPLRNVNGTLYGTTEIGGSHVGVNCASASSGACGTVFSITPGGKEKILYSFLGGTDGAYPTAGLIDVKGTLYGATRSGGAYNTGSCRPGCGTVFTITASGKEKVLHSFGNGTDGSELETALVDVNGTLYGTTDYGGAYGNGTVFSITPGGKEKVLYNFNGSDGSEPRATLLNVNGTLYGTTQYGGAYGYGTVFSITLSGQETVLYSFMGGQDGANPQSGVIDVNGTFYGATLRGGAHNEGTVFSITP